jgi:hypothetical protein
MQINANGIPVDIPGQRKKVAKIQTTKKLQNDFNQFTKFATMAGVEDGCKVTVIVPMGHKDFKTLLAQGFKVIDVWNRRDSA